MAKKHSDAEHGAAGGDIPGGGASEGPGGGLSFGDILTTTPEEIQKYLDEALERAPESVKAVIAAVDYVEPGSVRSPGFDYYLMLGMYEGDRDEIELAFQAQPGADLPLHLMLKLL